MFWRESVLSRSRRGGKRYCLFASDFDPQSAAHLRCDLLGAHVHLSHGEVFGDIAPAAIPKPLRADFSGGGGLLERGIAEWALVGSILRLRRSEVVNWQALDILLKRGDQGRWALAWRIDSTRRRELNAQREGAKRGRELAARRRRREDRFGKIKPLPTEQIGDKRITLEGQEHTVRIFAPRRIRMAR